jgi:glycogen phosphorylase
MDLRDRILSKLTYEVGKRPATARAHDWYIATALAVRDTVVDRWFDTIEQSNALGGKHVYYLSAEFLIGRLLIDAIGNLGMIDEVRATLAASGVDLDRLAEQEPDAGLGNGGLGRLAACFMDSMATLGIPAHGYGIRYQHGLFRQEIVDGRQIELPEEWLASGNPWEFERLDITSPVGFGGHVEAETTRGGTRYVWHPSETLNAIAYDTPVIGGGGRHANTLRLWAARAAAPLQLDAFNRGDHVGAMREKVRLESVSQVLYPGDDSDAGQELRLRQEYFFTAASLADILRRHLARHETLANLADKAAIQLNDTHPAIAVPELMRLLMDVHGMGWDAAWQVTVATISYTNHTLMPEALESWPVSLMERLLPRHMQIIYLLNGRHLERQRHTGPATDAAAAAASMIDERHGRRVRMGHVAFVGSHAINGVSAMHTELMRETVFADLAAIYPGRISNKTNGITFRRWLHRANPSLTALLVEVLGEAVLTDPTRLEGLAAHADDASLQLRFAACRRAAKVRLGRVIAERVGHIVNPDALFDVQIKRIHEYKRQLLNILQTVAEYNAIRAQPHHRWVPRLKILAGKAAPGYAQAKQLIRLACDVAHVINTDPSVGEALRVVFLANYNVSLAEMVIPAADLSEQISTAGMEASGTGNMKMALNGALTIGTLDGANVEIRERVGAANMFIFGLTAEEVEARRRRGLDAYDVIAASPALAQAMEAIRSGLFSPGEPDRYRPLMDQLAARDPFMVCADFDAYAAQQAEADALWQAPPRWWRAALLNTAHVGWFSSDRTIAQYAEEIWHVAPVIERAPPALQAAQ